MRHLIRTSLALLSLAAGCVAHTYRQSAEAVILDNAERNQVLIFGEDHSVDYDDDFFISLLPALKKKGFNKLALEFDSRYQPIFDQYMERKKDEDELYRQTYYLPSSGKKKILHAAREYGFNLYAIDYDNEKHTLYGTKRDKGMMQNLEDMVFRYDSNAKVIIFVGGVHINEASRIDSHTGCTEKYLGEFLDDYTRGKSYTIDMTSFNSPELLKIADERVDPITSLVLR